MSPFPTLGPVPSTTPADHQLTRLRAALHALPTGLAVFDPNRTIVFHNPRFLQLLAAPPQLPPHLAPNPSLDDLLQALAALPEYAAAIPFLTAEQAQNRTQPAQSRHTRTDGHVIDIQSTPAPDGSWTMTIADVTPLARVEHEAQARATMLDTVLRHVPHGISVYGPDGRLQMVNAAYDTIMTGAPVALGESVDEIIARRAHTGEYGPGDPNQLIVEQSVHDITKPQFRRRCRPNGKTIDIRTAPLPEGGHISVVTDATQLVEAEAEAVRHTRNLDAMLANIHHGIVLWDKDARIIAANAVVPHMLNASPGLMVPGLYLAESVQSALERGNLGEGATALARANTLLNQDRSKSHQDQRLTRDGRVLEVRSDPTPEGGFVTTYTDVTQVRQAEEALLLSKAAAEAANAAKSRFLAAMSTELRTPLNAVLREAGAITRDAADQLARLAARIQNPGGWDPALIQRSCAAITNSARTLLGLIDGILDVARLESGRFDLFDDHVELPLLIRACLRQFDAAAAAAEVALVVELPDNLPDLRADQRRLGQALGHLVSNALKFTDAMGSVRIGAQQDWATGDLLLHVQDTGPGIAETDLERAFEPFAKLGRQTPAGGAGLGLYVSRILLRAHGGDLMLRSNQGQGTTATLHIPANRVLQPTLPDPNDTTGPTD